MLSSGKKAADHIYDFFQGEIPDDPDNLKRIYGVVKKINLLTMQYAFDTIWVSISCDVCTIKIVLTNELLCFQGILVDMHVKHWAQKILGWVLEH